MNLWWTLAALAALAVMIFRMRRGDALLSWFAFILAFTLFGMAAQ